MTTGTGVLVRHYHTKEAALITAPQTQASAPNANSCRLNIAQHNGSPAARWNPYFQRCGTEASKPHSFTVKAHRFRGPEKKLFLNNLKVELLSSCFSTSTQECTSCTCILLCKFKRLWCFHVVFMMGWTFFFFLKDAIYTKQNYSSIISLLCCSTCSAK